MRRLVSIAVCFTVFAFVPLAAQDDGPNVFRVNFIKALPGKAALYSAAVQEYLVPRNEELVMRGYLVSYQTIRQNAGAGEYTHVHIFEYANWDAANDDAQSVNDDACRAVFGGKTCQEKLAEYGDLSTIRVFVRNEFYTSLKP